MQVLRNGEEVWVEDEDMEPGDRYKYKPVGLPMHWHEFIREELLPGDGCPTVWSRCVSGACDRAWE